MSQHVVSVESSFLIHHDTFRDEQLSVNGGKCTLSTGKLPLGVLLRNSVVRITDRPDMISAVYRGSKATNQTNKQNFS